MFRPSALWPFHSISRSDRMSFPTLINYIVRVIGNHMAQWRVIEQFGGQAEAVSKLATQSWPRAPERTVWSCQKFDLTEALRSTGKPIPGGC